MAVLEEILLPYVAMHSPQATIDDLKSSIIDRLRTIPEISFDPMCGVEFQGETLTRAELVLGTLFEPIDRVLNDIGIGTDGTVGSVMDVLDLDMLDICNITGSYSGETVPGTVVARQLEAIFKK